MRSPIAALVFLLLVATLAVGGESAPAATEAGQPRPSRAAASGAWSRPSTRSTASLSTTSGYTGGHHANPTYEQVSAGGTGHAESVQIVYDPKQGELREAARRLLAQHRSDRERPAVLRRRHPVPQRDLRPRRRSGGCRGVARRAPGLGCFEGSKVATEIVAGPFYPAEDYHQDYYKKNPLRYRYYRSGCGRDARLEELWGAKPQDH